MTHPAPLIADSISRAYAGRKVVDAASLTLAPGRITALLGASGAGKSTLLRLLAGLERPDAGQIMLGDTLLSSAKTMVPAEKRRVGLIFQDFALFPHLSAAQNIMFGLSAHTKDTAGDIAADWLARINLANRADAYPHQLSGGEQQRIAIARALAPEPVAILMDEPFSGLDPALREDVRRIALDTVRTSGTPALLVTHDATEAMLSADHLAVMRAGKIVQQGTSQQVYAQPVDKETAAAFGRIIVLEAHQNPTRTALNCAFGPVNMPMAAVDNPSTPVDKRGSTAENTPRLQLGIRPEAVLVDPQSPIKANVLSCRRNGPMQQVHISVKGTSAYILVPANTPIEAGKDCGIRLDPAGCVIFQA